METPAPLIDPIKPHLLGPLIQQFREASSSSSRGELIRKFRACLVRINDVRIGRAIDFRSVRGKEYSCE